MTHSTRIPTDRTVDPDSAYLEDVSIRPFQPTDAEACIAVIRSNMPAYFSESDVEDFRSFLTELPGEYFVVEHADAVVACGGWADNDDDTCALTWGAVEAGLHRRGIGNALMKHRLGRIAEASERSILRIETTPEVAPFFERHGFRAVEKKPDGFGDGFDQWIMKRTLSLALLFLLSVFIWQGAVAQDSEAQPPCTAISTAGLNDYEGTWDVDWKYRLEPGRYQESAARSVIESGLSGCALVERFEGVLRGVPFHVVSTMIVKEGNVVERSRLDSEHAAFNLSEGLVRNDSLVFETRRQFGERTMRTRHVFSPPGPNGFSTHFYLSRSLDDPWTLVEESFYRPAGE